MHSSSSEIFLNISIDEVCMYIITSFYVITSFAMMSNLTFFFKTRDFTKVIQKNCILYNLFFKSQSIQKLYRKRNMAFHTGTEFNMVRLPRMRHNQSRNHSCAQTYRGT